ncbi:hypothetical protein [Leptothoe sp. PORK10 BA2]|uniref:hypothetical protein n=1 Tax=Leptothoe sp. PORK10 BA2 TaxID=3110254 RepID=UPI002B1FEBBF|nr:hypothetical protein [Leptothoe sp. PORK10 BA2]MEA5462812.1 hypothetical protein [Leptothoe sp. PORK10 BA2]
MTDFQLGQIVKKFCGGHAHYGIVLSPDYTVNWVNNSTIELQPLDPEVWDIAKLKYDYLSWDEIKANIRDFRESLKTENSPAYNLINFNCEHWATWMATGHSYSTQVLAAKRGSLTFVGGGMVAIGSSTGTVVSVAALLGASASTGTATSALSGAAATNAALAWLGGGTLASGGGGMAAGAAIVSTVAVAGAGLAVAGVGIIGFQVWNNFHQKQQLALMAQASSASVFSAFEQKQHNMTIEQLLA